MFQYNFKIAWRNLKNRKFYSFVSVFGLALGMSCSLMIWFWAQDEMGYNKFYKNLNEIYYVHLNGKYEGKIYTNKLTPGPLSEALKNEVPEVAYAVKLSWENNYLITVDKKSLKQKGIYATEDLLNVFEFPAREGDPSSAIRSNQIIISQRLAATLFGNRSALGKSLKLNNDKEYAIGAVIDNIPANSSIQFDWVLNFREIEADWMQNWGNNGFSTYVKLQSQAKKRIAETNMMGIYGRYSNLEDIFPVMQPLKDVYLYSNFENGVPVGGRITYVRIFMLVAFFILAIACVNFINLATAHSTTRIKEVGLRKVMGAPRNTIITQFLSESVLITLMALIVAIIAVHAGLQTFNHIFDKQIRFDFSDPSVLLSLLGLFIITNILSGSYPAFYISTLKPARIINNNLKNSFSVNFLRKALVIFQFSLSIFLIIGIIVITKQMNYVHSKQTGLNREEVLYVPLEGDLKAKIEAVREEALQSSAILATTTSSLLPVNIQSSSTNLSWAGKDPDLSVEYSFMRIGYDFLKTMNIALVSGRDFSKDFSSDAKAYLLNESAAKLLGMEDPVGQMITSVNGEGTVIGVMKDFHIQSLHMPISPLILCLGPDFTQNSLLIKVGQGKVNEAIKDLKKLTRKFNPNYPFEYHFLDDDYEKLHKNEALTNRLINYFGTLAILISCLGLLALAVYAAEKRSKEISIRKILGASVGNILVMLSKDFIKPILMAIIIAIPFARYFMGQWLQSFSYNIAIQWWMFGLAGLFAMVIALLTVSFQSIKAATTNPVKSLQEN